MGIEEQLMIVEQESDTVLLVIVLDSSSIVTSSGRPQWQTDFKVTLCILASWCSCLCVNPSS